jgi:integrase
MGKIGSGVRQVTESSYEISFTFQGIRCRERIKLEPCPANLKRVINHLGEINIAIENGYFDYAKAFPSSKRRLLFIENEADSLLAEVYFDQWITHKSKSLKSSTLRDYVKVINNLIIPQFKGTYLSDIKRPALREWLSKMTCGNKRLTNIQSVMRTALQDAFMDELIEANPMQNWNYTNKEAPKKDNDIDPFTTEEQQRILNELTGQARNIFQFFFWTGLRTSELVALQWSDIDWEKGTINIYKALTQAAKDVEITKTKTSTREVKILAPAMEALLDQKQYTLAANKEIFQNSLSGKPLTGDQHLRKVIWKPALERANVKYRRPYQTRHTYASMMLSAGESCSWLASQMGHKDWLMIRKTYARYIKDSIPDAGEKAVKIFS